MRLGTLYIPSVPLDPGRTVDELRELRRADRRRRRRTAGGLDRHVGRRRKWLSAKVAPTGAVEEVDEAGNQWFTLGATPTGALLIGHIDPCRTAAGSTGATSSRAWRVLRRIAAGDAARHRQARQLGRRGGARRSLFGSSAASGTMTDQDELRERTDADGVRWRTRWPRTASTSTALDAHAQLASAAAYLELHIEQGPVLEALDLAARRRARDLRRGAAPGHLPRPGRPRGLDSDGQAPRCTRCRGQLALEIRGIAARTGDGAVCTMGSCVTKPGIVTSVVETATVLLDQRHLDAGKLAAMLAEAKEERALRGRGGRRGRVGASLAHRPDPLRRAADRPGRRSRHRGRRAVHRLPSGPLHDAAEVSRAGVPTVMLFVQSLRGLSHTKLEDTKPEHLELSVRALDRLAAKTIDQLTAG